MDAIEFWKYQATGNDFILIEDLKKKIDFSPEVIRKLCDRHYGVGADGVLVVYPSKLCDFYMLFFNPDGSCAEMCGNGIRCFAKYLYDKGYINKESLTVETLSGPKEIELLMKEGKVWGARVNMGKPAFKPQEIPVKLEGEEIIAREIEVGSKKVKITCVSMGNPHAVIFVDSVKDAPVTSLGPLIENHSLFPERTNVEFVEIVSPAEFRVRVWERGAGETLACGTGACASLVASVKNGFSEKEAVIHLAGGDLTCSWQEDVYLLGEAKEVFSGKINLKNLF